MNSKICAVIPTFNEEQFIGKLIDSIKNNSYKNIEIIVVDDNSTDNTVKIAKEKGVKVLINSLPRKGPSFGWNKAAKETNAELICILGADFVFEDKTFFEKSIQPFDDLKVVSVKTKYHTIQCNWVEKAVTHEWGISMEPRLIRKKDFLKIGGFDLIGYGEDQLFTEKIKDYLEKNKLKEIILTNTFFSGHGIHSLKEMFSQAKWYGKTSIHFFKKLKGLNKLKKIHSTYLRMFYLFSFIFGFFGFIFYPLYLFWIYFLLVFIKIIFNSIKEKNLYRSLRIFTYFLFGLGLFYGLILYFLGNKAKGK